MAITKVKSRQLNIQPVAVDNLLKNGNFINNSTNGYGGTADDWTNSSGNPVQGGFPTMTKQQLIDLLGIADGDIEGLWNLNGNFNDLSSNGYNLTATNSPTDSTDSLMAQAKSFASASSQYATITNASNLNITSSLTIFAYFKLSTVSADQDICGVAPSNVANFYGFRFSTSTKQITFFRSGVTNSGIASDVQIEAGKWYLAVGVWSSAGTLVSITINGVKKSATATGTPTSTGGFSVGRLGDNASNYINGLVQNVCILSTALTDAQVKRLWAATSYKGTKLRRSTTDGIVYQYLGEDLVERLRGKTLTLSAKMYQDTANVGGIRINDGTSTTSTDSTTTGSWVDVSVTKTISATATSIYVALVCDSADGNVWYKEVALYESDTPLPFNHSKDDWSRFPRLLRMNIPSFNSAKPYQYEENKWYAMDPSYAGFSTEPSGNTVEWSYYGKICWISHSSITGASNSATFTHSAPIYSSSVNSTIYGIPIVVYDNGSWQTGAGVAGVSSGTVYIGKTLATVNGNAYAGFTASGNKTYQGTIMYEID